ncbi:hypothetical protein [Halorussus halophilus]|uniref:hypothetical protein n=1 Tax=Halorussus halophilus TaxID=2650975 RepID=UPI0013019770|nr:hypothetical protein [Halorussus halophilus]
MDRSRLGHAVLDAVFVSFLLASVAGPPDPVTQLLYLLPALAVTLPLAYHYDVRLLRRMFRGGWKRFLLFFVVLVVTQAIYNYSNHFASGFVGSISTAIHLAGAVVALWLAYFGGLETLRGGSEVA